MSQRKGRTIKMSEKTYNAELNKAYTEGYNNGYVAGVNDGFTRKYTPNQARAIFGLPPIKDELNADTVSSDELVRR